VKVERTAIPGVLAIEPRVFRDARGFFLETFNRERYAQAGVDVPCVQVNQSRSSRGVLRGLHYQLRRPQAKLVWAARGEILDVAADIRRGSPTFGRWVAVVLSEENNRQLFVPAGCAHGFYTLSATADVIYACSDLYDPDDDRGVRYDDPELAVGWPPGERTLSAKDLALPPLADAELPVWAG
jgi:dTDP-4-dehydrorhamnose 3,5-epimerase